MAIWQITARETSITLGHMRGHRCRDLLVYCTSPWCNHSAKLTLDWLGDDTALRSRSAHGLYRVRTDRCRRAAGLDADDQSPRRSVVAEPCSRQEKAPERPS